MKLFTTTIAVLFLLLGCKKNQTIANSLIVGKWTVLNYLDTSGVFTNSTNSDGTEYLDFRSDGKLYENSDLDFSITSTGIKYTIKSNRNYDTSTYQIANNQVIKTGGQNTVANIISLTSNQLILYSISSIRRRIILQK